MIIGDSMASAIMHICVAKRVNEILKQNEKELFLGSIAPDISKQIGESKTKTHFLSNDGDVPELKDFLEKYKDNLKDNAFNIGYYCHLFTDMIWFGLFLKNYCNFDQTEIRYNNGEVKIATPELILKILYNDYTNLNIKLIDIYNLDLSLFYEDFQIPNTTINEIPIEKLHILINQMGIIIENSKEEKAYTIDIHLVDNFIKCTCNEILKKLKALEEN